MGDREHEKPTNRESNKNNNNNNNNNNNKQKDSKNVEPLYQTKCHSFGPSKDNTEDELEIQVREVISGDYGLYVWPSAIVMAEYVWRLQEEFIDKIVMEIGAGTGLPSLVASCVATTRVYITDYDKATQTLDNLKYNCDLNAALFATTPEVFGLTWGDFSLKIFSIDAPDIILGADCFYDNSAEFDNILATVAYFFRKKPNSIFLTTYQVRSANRSIGFLLEKWGMEANNIPLESFMDQDKLEDLNQEIELVRITPKKSSNK